VVAALRSAGSRGGFVATVALPVVAAVVFSAGQLGASRAMSLLGSCSDTVLWLCPLLATLSLLPLALWLQRGGSKGVLAASDEGTVCKNNSSSSRLNDQIVDDESALVKVDGLRQSLRHCEQNIEGLEEKLERLVASVQEVTELQTRQLSVLAAAVGPPVGAVQQHRWHINLRCSGYEVQHSMTYGVMIDQYKPMADGAVSCRECCCEACSGALIGGRDHSTAHRFEFELREALRTGISLGTDGGRRYFKFRHPELGMHVPAEEGCTRFRFAFRGKTVTSLCDIALKKVVVMQ